MTMIKANFKYNEKALEEYVKELQEDPRVKNIIVTKENANLVEQMLDSISHCKNCKSLNECPNNIQGYTKTIKDNSLVMEKCKFLKGSLENEAAFKKFKCLFMPENVIKSTIDDYNLTTDSRKKAYKKAVKLIQEIDTIDKGLYLYGEFGVGKTYLLAAIANELIKKGKTVLLAYFPDLVRALKNSLDNSTNLENMINDLKTVDVLMLDDLGSENLTPWLRDEILGPVLNYRYMSKKIVCISSNLNQNELIKHLSHTNQDDDNIKGSRIARRLMTLCGNSINVSDDLI